MGVRHNLGMTFAKMHVFVSDRVQRFVPLQTCSLWLRPPKSCRVPLDRQQHLPHCTHTHTEASSGVKNTSPSATEMSRHTLFFFVVFKQNTVQLFI